MALLEGNMRTRSELLSLLAEMEAEHGREAMQFAVIDAFDPHDERGSMLPDDGTGLDDREHGRLFCLYWRAYHFGLQDGLRTAQSNLREAK